MGKLKTLESLHFTKIVIYFCLLQLLQFERMKKMKTKKTRLFAALLSGMLVFSGCAAKEAADVIQEASKQITATPTPMPTATPEPTPAVTQLELGKKAKVGDWEFTVKKASIKTKIMTSKYMGYEAAKGNKYVCLSMSVKNNGAKEETFLPRVGYENEMITAIIHYQDQYEYKPSELSSYDKDIAGESIKPLDKKSGLLVFEVPKEVASNLDKATVQIGTSAENVVYPLKK